MNFCHFFSHAVSKQSESASYTTGNDGFGVSIAMIYSSADPQEFGDKYVVRAGTEFPCFC